VQGIYKKNKKPQTNKKNHQGKLLLMLEQLPSNIFSSTDGPGGPVWFILIPWVFFSPLRRNMFVALQFLGSFLFPSFGSVFTIPGSPMEHKFSEAIFFPS